MVLDQCSSENNKSPFVHNRVVNNRKLCKEFEIRYVKSLENPADLLTKSVNRKFAQEFLTLKLWWEGADWVTEGVWHSEKQYNLFPELTHNLKNAWIVGGKIEIEIPNKFMNI